MNTAKNPKANGQNAYKWFFPLALGALTLVVFGSCVFFERVNYDDVALTTDNILVQSLAPGNLARMFTFFCIESYYPIRLLSVAVDYAFWGANPMGYHLSNVLIHVLNVLMVYGLVLVLSVTQGMAKNKARLLSFFTAAFFGIHPVVVDTVAWIAGREELLTLFFCLLCFRLYIWAEYGKNRLILRVLCAYACAFACLSNVVGAMVPALIFFYIMVLDKNPSLKKAVARTWHLWLIGAIAVFIKILSLLAWDDSSRTSLMPHLPSAIRYFPELLDTPRLMYGSPVSFLTQFKAVTGVYWENLLYLACPLNMPCIYPDYIPEKFFSLNVMGGCAAIAATVFALFYTRKNKLLFFGIVWFLICLFPSSMVIQHHILRADRFLYMPVVGLSLAFCHVVLSANIKAGARRARILFLVLVFFLGVRSAMHLPVWTNGLTLHTHSTRLNPDFFLGHFYMAQELKRLDMYDEALVHHRKAILLQPEANFIWHPFFEALIELDRLDEAEAIAKKAVMDYPDNAHTHNNLAIILSELGKFEESLEHFEKAVALSLRSVVMRENVADEYAAQGNHKRAIYHLKEALKINPRAAMMHLRLALSMEKAGDVQGAIAHYSLAKRYDHTFLGVDFRMQRLKWGRAGLDTDNNQQDPGLPGKKN